MICEILERKLKIGLDLNSIRLSLDLKVFENLLLRLILRLKQRELKGRVTENNLGFKLILEVHRPSVVFFCNFGWRLQKFVSPRFSSDW